MFETVRGNWLKMFFFEVSTDVFRACPSLRSGRSPTRSLRSVLRTRLRRRFGQLTLFRALIQAKSGRSPPCEGSVD